MDTALSYTYTSAQGKQRFQRTIYATTITTTVFQIVYPTNNPVLLVHVCSTFHFIHSVVCLTTV
jgi:hypothetical protein